MPALRSLTMARHHLLVVIFACALLLRLAVPAGWMPVAQADGRVRLALCPGAAPAASKHMAHVMGQRAHDHGPASHDRGEHAPPCAFTGLALAAALPDVAPAPRLLPIVAPPPAMRRALVSIGSGLAAPPPPQTGPPPLA